MSEFLRYERAELNFDEWRIAPSDYLWVNPAGVAAIESEEEPSSGQPFAVTRLTLNGGRFLFVVGEAEAIRDQLAGLPPGESPQPCQPTLDLFAP